MKAVYRIFVGLCIALFIVATLIGCGRNISSQGEAAYAASQLPDFEKLIAAESIYGMKTLADRQKVQFGGSNQEYYVIHVVIYKDKGGNIKTVCFNDERPPKIVK